MMADWAMVILTAIYVIATILICCFNYKSAKASREQASEMRRQYEEENRPYITVELIFERKSLYGLRFTNHGKKIANNVSIQFEQSFLEKVPEPSFKELLEEVPSTKCIIGIGQHHDIYLGTNKLRERGEDVVVSGQVTYCDGTNSYSEPFFIDFATYATIFTTRSNADDFLDALKKQNQELRKIETSLRELVINSRISHNETNEPNQ